ncbi:MAG TPA: YbaK/EbsC family protein [Thermoleophilia bacterium]|nr:YbaK/EbsC family protein [Thermoleophilia bacterium]
MRSFTDVSEALVAAGLPHEIIHLPSSSRTAQLAADALGVAVPDVVKSLVFLADGRAVVTLVPGDATVDTLALARELGVHEVTLARGREVREWTGYKPGAVPPVGLATALPVVADPGVFVPEVVYCGGGTSTAVLRARSAGLKALVAPRRVAIGSRS